jgi:hypothetical protein
MPSRSVALGIQRLSGAHDRAGFDCGSDPLNRYLKETKLLMSRHVAFLRGVSPMNARMPDLKT